MRTLKLMIIALLFIGCEQNKEYSKYPLKVKSSNGSGWSWSTATILCDSVNMINTKKAEVFKDGTKLNIEAENYIRVYEN